MNTKLLNNRYQIIQVLGAGGFGETSLAEDTHLPSRRRCVIKELKPIAHDPTTWKIIQERFEREATILENLGENSDQIPKLYAYFPENGKFYLVQEWIEGQTLSSMIQSQGKLHERTVREILLSLLSVLEYVHSKGIIHRDIKPDNIILRTADDKPVLIDFGAVKETIRTMINPLGNPAQSIVIGTPGYMPIEQAIGRPVYATDIYSLGLTAIYLLTGKYPQELPTNPQTGQIVWQQFVPHISPDLLMVLTQAVEPKISDRYSTASQMLYALQSSNNYTINNTVNNTINTSKVNNSVPTVAPTQAITPDGTIAVPSNEQSRISHNSSGSSIWQNPLVIMISVIVGTCMGVIIISQFNRQEAIVNNPNTSNIPVNSPGVNNTIEATPESLSEINSNTQISRPIETPIETPNRTPNQTPTEQLPSVEPTPENINTPLETPSEIVSTPTGTPETNNTETSPQTGLSPTFTPERKPKKIKTNEVVNHSQTVPAFPTGTNRNTVEATLGKTKKDYRGLWGNTRAVTYKFVPNKIDLGYLFDRDTGILKQTEVAFASSVDNQLMEGTLNNLLSGQMTPEIQRGLQKIQGREKDNFTFSQGGVKGQIIRQNCDFIYISIWDADLHDFVDPSSAKQC